MIACSLRLLGATTLLLAGLAAASAQDALPDPSMPEMQPAPQAPDAVAPEAAAPPAPAGPTRLTNPIAEFAGLDKITGRIITFDVYMNETVQFGALQVTPRVCYSRPPTEPPRTDAFVEVDEITLARKVRRIFTGWMFADSPGLHAVDHAVYDVWLASCKTSSTVAPPGSR
jgi:hypothetical protein